MCCHLANAVQKVSVAPISFRTNGFIKCYGKNGGSTSGVNHVPTSKYLSRILDLDIEGLKS